MERRNKVELIVACLLILTASIVTILPIFNISNIKIVFIIIIAFYSIVHLIKNLLIIKTNDYTGFYITAAGVVTLSSLLFLDISDSPWNLALVLFIWLVIVSLVKLKECDFYHDNRNRLWKLNIINLVIFDFVGLLACINLNYTGDIQIIILGFFFLINGILELMDPLAAYLIKK